MKKSKPKPTAVEEVKCGCCDKPIELVSENMKIENLLCAGCGEYICNSDTCFAGPCGKHEAWKHKPCDVCGESVDDPGAAICENCQ